MKEVDSNANREKPTPGKATPVAVEVVHRSDAAPVQQQISGPLSGVIPVECLTYSVEQTALVLGVDKSTVYSLIARGFFAPLEGLRHKRLPKKQVHDYVDGHLVPRKKNFSASTFSPASACSWNGKKRRIRRKPVGAANNPKQQEKTA